jgi:hypothetical protein
MSAVEKYFGGWLDKACTSKYIVQYEQIRSRDASKHSIGFG